MLSINSSPIQIETISPVEIRNVSIEQSCSANQYQGVWELSIRLDLMTTMVPGQKIAVGTKTPQGTQIDTIRASKLILWILDEAWLDEVGEKTVEELVTSKNMQERFIGKLLAVHLARQTSK